MNVGWIVLILFVCTIAELIISPVGISLATKLAPEGAPREHDGAVLHLRGNGYRALRLVGSVLQHGD